MTCYPIQTVSFLLPGGKVTFDDGTVAEVYKEKEFPLLKDHRYALLPWTQRKKEAFDPRGLMREFELLSNGSVHPHAYYSWDSLQAVRQLTQEQFFAAAETAAREEKRLTEK